LFIGINIGLELFQAGKVAFLETPQDRVGGLQGGILGMRRRKQEHCCQDSACRFHRPPPAQSCAGTLSHAWCPVKRPGASGKDEERKWGGGVNPPVGEWGRKAFLAPRREGTISPRIWVSICV